MMQNTTHQVEMFHQTRFSKKKKQTWKTGTQVFTQDSNEIQHVLQLAKPYVHVITMRAIAEYKKYRKLNEQSNVVISHAHETRSAF